MESPSYLYLISWAFSDGFRTEMESDREVAEDLFLEFERRMQPSEELFLVEIETPTYKTRVLRGVKYRREIKVFRGPSRG